MRRFIEDKGLLSTSILVKRQREGWGKKLCSVIQVYLQRHLTTVDNILLQIADMKDLLASQNSKIFFPRKRKTNLGTFNITVKLNSLVLLKKWKTVFLHIYLLTWLRNLYSCYVSLSDWLTTIFVNPWKNQKYPFIINLFASLLQMKLFLRNNKAFTMEIISMLSLRSVP